MSNLLAGISDPKVKSALLKKMMGEGKNKLSKEMRPLCDFIKTTYAVNFFGAANWRQRGNADNDLGDHIDGAIVYAAIESILAGGGKRNNRSASRAGIRSEVKDASPGGNDMLQNMLMLSLIGGDMTDLEDTDDEEVNTE